MSKNQQESKESPNRQIIRVFPRTHDCISQAK